MQARSLARDLAACGRVCRHSLAGPPATHDVRVAASCCQRLGCRKERGGLTRNPARTVEPGLCATASCVASVMSSTSAAGRSAALWPPPAQGHDLPQRFARWQLRRESRMAAQHKCSEPIASVDDLQYQPPERAFGHAARLSKATVGRPSVLPSLRPFPQAQDTQCCSNMQEHFVLNRHVELVQPVLQVTVSTQPAASARV